MEIEFTLNGFMAGVRVLLGTSDLDSETYDFCCALDEVQRIEIDDSGC
jgi:hypothetical protein